MRRSGELARTFSTRKHRQKSISPMQKRIFHIAATGADIRSPWRGRVLPAVHATDLFCIASQTDLLCSSGKNTNTYTARTATTATTTATTATTATATTTTTTTTTTKQTVIWSLALRSVCQRLYQCIFLSLQRCWLGSKLFPRMRPPARLLEFIVLAVFAAPGAAL